MQWEPVCTSGALQTLKLLWGVTALAVLGIGSLMADRITDAEEGDLSRWQISYSQDYYKGGYGRENLSIAPEGKEGGPVHCSGHRLPQARA